MMGIPGSGKSTFVRKRRDIFDNPIVISRDKIRFSLLEEGDEYFSKEEILKFIKNDELRKTNIDAFMDFINE